MQEASPEDFTSRASRAGCWWCRSPFPCSCWFVAGLFTRSLENAQRSDPGSDPDHVLLESFELRPSGYSRAQAIEFDRQLLAKIEALRGVQFVTLADFSPLSYTIRSTGVQ